MFTVKEILESKLKKGIKIIIPVIQNSQKSEGEIKQLAENSTNKAIEKFKNKEVKKNGSIRKVTN